MIPLFSTNQVREIDDYAINKLGLPGLVLMENAALQIFNIILEKTRELPNRNKIGFICGKGNNGGDGFAVARQFANYGFNVCVIYTSSEDELSADCKINFNVLETIAKESENILLKKYSSLKDLRYIADCDIIFDALLGSGTKGSLKEPYITIIENINKVDAFKVAVDIPTGLNADTGFAENAFNADITVTLGELKKGLFFEDGYKNSGEIVKGNIGISSSFFDKYETGDYLIEPEDILNSLPSKAKNIHKYSAGKVLVISGSGELPGAATLAANSALKIGAGASVLCYPGSSRKLLSNKYSEVIVKTYKDNGKEYLSENNIDELQQRIDWADVVALGPGLGRNEETVNAVRKLLKDFKSKKFVIDADAIFAIGNDKFRDINLEQKILTPHHGEFANLIGINLEDLRKDLISFGKDFSMRTGSYLVLKGAPTIIFTPEGESLINSVGNAGMAKFGTGDVLTGVIAGLLAQHNDVEKAVVAGVYLHSLAADLLLKDFTEFGYTATDIINKLPAAIKFIRNSFA